VPVAALFVLLCDISLLVLVELAGALLLAIELLEFAAEPVLSLFKFVLGVEAELLAAFELARSAAGVLTCVDDGVVLLAIAPLPGAGLFTS